MKWLHLSDLHFNYKNYDSENLKSSLIKTLSDIKDIEFIVITGDCIYQFDRNLKNTDNLVDFIEKIGKNVM